jgi:signal transduction histidine kinase
MIFQGLEINYNLIIVGIASIVTLILGLIVFLNDRKSYTNKSFFFLTSVTIAYNIFNYLSYQVNVENLTVILIKYTLLFAFLQAFAILQFFYVFPANNLKLANRYKFPVAIFLVLISFIILSNLTVRSVELSGISGAASKPVYGVGMAFFGLGSISLIIAGLVILVRKTLHSKDVQRNQLKLVAVGTFLTFTSILLFNLILPAIFSNVTFVPLASLFTLPFAFFTAYSIIKYNLLNIKVIATQLLIFSLWMFIFIRTILSTNTQELIMNLTLLLITVLVGIFLIRSVLKEVKQREKIETLAKDLEKSNTNLENANERLKELDQLKSEFISIATHQIRAPLTAIKGYISLIQEGDFGPVSKEIKGALDIVQQSSNNLVTIVGDFLDVSRIEQGRMAYNYSKFDVRKLAEQVIAELRPNIEKKGLELKYSFEENKDYVTYADQGKVKQVIGNIIDNSVKYTPKGFIEIAVVKPTEKKILIRISDSGVGIHPLVMPKLFQKFSRAKNANEVNILGTGLGLYVARQLIEAHHGSLWAQSEGEGKGSQFYIELPVQENAPEVRG